MKNYKLILLIITLTALLVDIGSLKFRSKKILAQAGALKMELKSKVKILFIVIYLFCFALPVVMFFKDFNILYSITFCLVAVLGCEVTTKDCAMLGKNGIYENCIIQGEIIIFYDDIVSFPILELPEEEQTSYDHSILVVASRLKGNVNVIFQSEEECSAATKLIRELSGK
ncbi:MAG: hypothetical protein HUK25_07335 [Treponema sp.]|nr:hypothetical protein [Treponema sp.]